MNSPPAQTPRLIAVLGSLLLMLGILAALQAGMPQTAKASSRTEAPVRTAPVARHAADAHAFRFAVTSLSHAAPGRISVIGPPRTSIENEPCTPGRASWVHVYTVSDGTFCLGFRGTYIFNYGNGRWVNRITFGNNYGNMDYEFHGTTGLVQVYENFDESELDCTQVGGCLMEDLTINGWH